MSLARSSGPAQSHGRREHRKHVTRRELLVAGRRLFSEHGIYESRIEDLTRHAGIAKGTLYGYFANKEELIEAVVTSGLAELLERARRDARGARPRAERVACLARAHVTFYEENPDLMRIFHQVLGMLKFSRPERLRLRPVIARYLAALGQLLSANAQARRGGGRARLATATLLFGAVSGIASTASSLAGAIPNPLASRAALGALVELVREFENPRAGRAVLGSARRARRPATVTRRRGSATVRPAAQRSA